MKLFLESKFDLVPVMHVLKDATGGNKKVKSSEFLDSGHIAIVDQSSDCLISGYSNDKSLVFKTESPVIIFGDHTRVVKYIEFPFILGADGTKALIPKNQDENDAKFLYYQLKSLRIPSAGYSRHFKFLKEEKLAIPPLPEQQRITDILDKAEAINQKREQALALCNEFLRATFLDMFGDPVSNPKGWEVTDLERATNKITDGTHHSPPITDEGIPYITAKHLKKDGLHFFDNPWYISLEDHKNIFSRCNPEKGDVLYIKDGATTGIAAINEYDFEFSMLSSLALIKCDEGILNPYFLCSMLNNDRNKQKLISNMGGAAIKRLTLTKIKKIEIIVPPIELQQKFSEIVEKVNAITARIQHAQELPLFDALSQQAFKGELTQ